jgi:SAM-dependent methyltransferase
MTNSLAYYDRHASAYFAATALVDMRGLHRRFLSHIPAGGLILDAGCGSGRDTKAFIGQGFRVVAFDGSASMAELASRHCGQHVSQRKFAEVSEQACYDGVWACASLLHLPVAEIPDAIARLWAALKPGGVAYLSFKHGTGERQDSGRHFTDAEQPRLAAWLEVLPEFSRAEYWTSVDQRPGRDEAWINVIVVRRQVEPAKLVTGGDDPFLPHLCAAIRQAAEIDFAVAFTKISGLRLLLADLYDARSTEVDPPHLPARIPDQRLPRHHRPRSLALAAAAAGAGAEVRVYTTQEGSFHLKAYIFAKLDGQGSRRNRVHRLQQHQPAGAAGRAWSGTTESSTRAIPGFSKPAIVSRVVRHPKTVALSDAWIEAYEQRRLPPSRSIAPGSHEQEAPPEPRQIQHEALAALRPAAKAATGAAWWCWPPVWARPGWRPSTPCAWARDASCSSRTAKRSWARPRPPSCASCRSPARGLLHRPQPRRRCRRAVRLGADAGRAEHLGAVLAAALRLRRHRRIPPRRGRHLPAAADALCAFASCWG